MPVLRVAAGFLAAAAVLGFVVVLGMILVDVFTMPTYTSEVGREPRNPTSQFAICPEGFVSREVTVDVEGVPHTAALCIEGQEQP
jgi:hypothetical protein